MKEYLVLEKRDFREESSRKYSKTGRMIYDKINSYDLTGLLDYAEKNDALVLGDGSSLAFRALSLSALSVLGVCADIPSEIGDTGRYVVAGFFPSKYFHYDYGGGSDAVPSHDVFYAKSGVDAVRYGAKLRKEGATKIYTGMEVNVLELAKNNILARDSVEKRIDAFYSMPTDEQRRMLAGMMKG